jgi:anti-sigma B factor antagonist
MMKASFEKRSSALNVVLNGDLIGGEDAMQFSKSLREAIGNPAMGLTMVHVDAAGVGFVNSSGLGMLLAARQAAKDAGANLSLVNPPMQLKSLLEMTKLSEILGVE